MKDVDITLPVLMDMAVNEFRATSEVLKQQAGINAYIIECALERVLVEIKDKRLSLYGTTIFRQNQENFSKQTGNKDELIQFAEDNGVPIPKDNK